MILETLLIGLAGWRLASLLVNEMGPWHIFDRLRTLVGVKPGLIGAWAELFSCVWCMSIWTTLAAYFLYQIEPRAVMVVAAAAVAILVEQQVK